MTALLLAAGRGERLRPLTDAVPKPALPMLDVPLGAFALASLSSASSHVAVNVSHLGEAVTAALEPFAPAGGLEVVVERPVPLGTGGTLRALRHRVGARVVTWNADLLSDLEARALVAAHERSGAPATVAVARVESGADFEIGEGRALRFVDRRVEPDTTGHRFLGAAVFTPSALDLLSGASPLGMAEALLRPLAERGLLAVHAHEGYGRDVGTPARYLDASLDLLEGRGPEPPVAWPGARVEVDGGIAYVGPGAEASTESLRAGAILLSRCLVEPGARVAESMVWPGERVPAGTTLARSIWARGASLPASSSRAKGPRNGPRA